MMKNIQVTLEQKVVLSELLRHIDNNFVADSLVRFGVNESFYGLQTTFTSKFKLPVASPEDRVEEEFVKLVLDTYSVVLEALANKEKELVVVHKTTGFRLNQKHEINIYIYLKY